MNYADLVTKIASYATRQNDADFLAQIPFWFQLVEAELNRKLRATDAEVRSQITIAQRYITLPDDCLELTNIQYGDGTPIDVKSPQQIDSEANEPGVPMGYCLTGRAIQLDREPVNPVTVEIAYYMAVPPLTASNNLNWLSSKHPDAYLFGALSHAAAWVNNDERIGVWASKYTQIVNDIAEQTEMLKYRGSILTMQMDPLRVY